MKRNFKKNIIILILIILCTTFNYSMKNLSAINATPIGVTILDTQKSSSVGEENNADFQNETTGNAVNSEVDKSVNIVASSPSVTEPVDKQPIKETHSDVVINIEHPFKVDNDIKPSAYEQIAPHILEYFGRNPNEITDNTPIGVDSIFNLPYSKYNNFSSGININHPKIAFIMSRLTRGKRHLTNNEKSEFLNRFISKINENTSLVNESVRGTVLYSYGFLLFIGVIFTNLSLVLLVINQKRN